VLRVNGVPAEMLRFPDTPHIGSILGPISHRRAQNEALLEWMNRHVLGVATGEDEKQLVEAL
jgi:dipeptidyl aminopeptidase/acylaminoacyl peptidase